LSFNRRSDPLDPHAAQDVRGLGVPDADHLMTEREGLLDLLVDLRARVVQNPELVVDAQEDLLGLALERVHDVDEAVRHSGGERLRLDLLDHLLDHGLRELLELLLVLLLHLLRLLVLLLCLPEGLLLAAQLLQQLLERLLLTELLELLHGAGPHAEALLAALTALLSEALLAALLLVGRGRRELLTLLLSLLAHLRGDAHAGVTFRLM
jgi:hypothetical protein